MIISNILCPINNNKNFTINSHNNNHNIHIFVISNVPSASHPNAISPYFGYSGSCT